MVDLEVLFSARTFGDYEGLLEERRSLSSAPITPQVMAAAIELQRALAQRGQHRLPIPDLIISAAAEMSGLTVMHYDADFELIAAVGGAPQEWVVRRGSI
jgi:predicted nucleic acid-binding protein